MEVVEYTDAMCSWAWGTEPKLRRFRWRFEDQISLTQVMGHLVEDEHMPDRDPVAGAPKLQRYWRAVHGITGMPGADPLHRTTRGSMASGLTMRAAARQGDGVAELVMRRLREATFVFGEPPDSPERTGHAVRGVQGLDEARLAADVVGVEVASAYEADRERTRRPNREVLELDGDRPGIGRARATPDGRMRFVFPTLVFRGPGGEHTAPGWVPYEDYEEAFVAAGGSLADARRDPTPQEAFERWPTLAPIELAQLCGPDALVPEGVVTHRWAGGELHLRSDEAVALDL